MGIPFTGEVGSSGSSEFLMNEWGKAMHRQIIAGTPLLEQLRNVVA
jgi:hypothetical protein